MCLVMSQSAVFRPKLGLGLRSGLALGLGLGLVARVTGDFFVKNILNQKVNTTYIKFLKYTIFRLAKLAFFRCKNKFKLVYNSF